MLIKKLREKKKTRNEEYKNERAVYILTFSLRRQNPQTDVADVRATAGMLEIACAVQLAPILIVPHVAVLSSLMPLRGGRVQALEAYVVPGISRTSNEHVEVVKKRFPALA